MNLAATASLVVWSSPKERLYSYEQVAYFTQTPASLIEKYASLGILNPTRAMFCRQDLVRVVQIRRLQREQGLNLAGAVMVLNLLEEISRLRGVLKFYCKAST